MHTSGPSLKGLRVLVTRPRGLAEAFAERLSDLGAVPVVYPALKIVPPDDVEARDRAIDGIASADILIFISPTAVEQLFELIDELPTTPRIASIGSSTGRRLEERGYRVDMVAPQDDSESLLTLPDLRSGAIESKRVVIIAGDGGRRTLVDTLTSRGARVDKIALYQRQINDELPRLDAASLTTLDFACVTSNESLQALLACCDDHAALFALPLLVPGERNRSAALEAGFEQVTLTGSATDDAFIEKLSQLSVDVQRS